MLVNLKLIVEFEVNVSMSRDELIENVKGMLNGSPVDLQLADVHIATDYSVVGTYFSKPYTYSTCKLVVSKIDYESSGLTELDKEIQEFIDYLCEVHENLEFSEIYLDSYEYYVRDYEGTLLTNYYWEGDYV